MITLTREDWCEIYYALESKSQALRRGAYQPEVESGEDARWTAHLDALKKKIGPDGSLAAPSGIPRSK